MDDVERAIARATFLAEVQAEPGLEGASDDQLVDAGNAICDAFDRGDSLQSALAVGAGLLPSAGSADAIAVVAGVATGTLCPEHAA